MSLVERVRAKGGWRNLARIVVGIGWDRLAASLRIALLRLQGVRVGRGVSVHGSDCHCSR